MQSAFGVEDDRISKADDDSPPPRYVSTGRDITTALASPIHGAVAGRPGKKWRSFGNELGGGLLGSVGGGMVDVATKGKTRGWGAQVGGSAGAVAGGRRNARKGYLKPV